MSNSTRNKTGKATSKGYTSKKGKKHEKGQSYEGRDRSDRNNRSDRDSMRSDTRVKGHDILKDSPCTNDASWYNANGKLSEIAGRFSFNDPTGVTIDFNRYNTGNATGIEASFKNAVPGIFSIEYIPGPGTSEDGTAAVNVAARAIYSWIRSANSGARNYDPNDLMMYLLTMDEAYSFLSSLIRVYGTMKTTSMLNRYFAKGAVNAMGFDYDDLVNELPQLEWYINYCILQLSRFAIPAQMSYIARHTWMQSGIYTDGTSPKSQAYIYKAAGYRIYDPTNQGGGKLQYFAFADIDNTMDKDGGLVNKTQSGEVLLTMKGIKYVMSGMLNVITEDEDIATISGDLYKAFGDGGILHFTPMPADYVVPIVYDEEVLSQMQNTTFCGNPVVGSTPKTYPTFDITQDNNIGQSTVVYTPNFKFDKSVNAAANCDKLITFNNDMNISPDLVMVGTRMSVICQKVIASDWIFPKSCGSELATVGKIWNTTDGGITFDATIVKSSRQIDISMDKVETYEWKNLTDFFESYSDVSAFKYAPAHLITLRSITGSTGTWFGPYLLQELDTYTILTPPDLEKLHVTALLSMFNVPTMGGYAMTL